MYKLTLINEDSLQLEFNNLGGAYNITNITGLSPAKATINTNQAALIDGAIFNSSKVQMRTINIAFTIEERVEYNRLFVYYVLRPKKAITVHYQSNVLDVSINGYVESVNVTHFDKKQKATVSILCPSPYWQSALEVITEMSAVDNMFYFPFASEGGKNLLTYPYYQTSRTAVGLTYTDNGDGSITIDGTNTSSSTQAFVCRSRTSETFTLPKGTYKLTGGINSQKRVVINYQGSNGVVTLAASSGNPVTFVVTDQIANIPLQVGIYTAAGASYDNVTFYPMIYYATYADDTWQPYDYGEIVFGEFSSETTAIVQNFGGIETGLTFELFATDSITNPKIFNYQTNEFIGLNFSMEAGDHITITTGIGNKTVTLFRNGQYTNLLNYLMQGSTFLQLPNAGGIFIYTVDSGLIADLEITIKHYDLYEGV